MNPFEHFPILTLYVVKRPLRQVVDEYWFDCNEREPNFTGFPQRIIDALGSSLEPARNLLRKETKFDLGWVCRLNRQATLISQALFWRPQNCPDYTAIIVNPIAGEPDYLGPSTWCRDWKSLWAYVNDQDASNSLCRFSYTSEKEEIFREVWCGLDTEPRTPKWQFYASGPVQFFEDPAQYKHKRIRDRLTRAHIGRFFAQFGADISAPEFWSSASTAFVFWRNMNDQFPEPFYCPDP